MSTCWIAAVQSGNRVESLVREMSAYCFVTTVMWCAQITLLYQPRWQFV